MNGYVSTVARRCNVGRNVKRISKENVIQARLQYLVVMYYIDRICLNSVIRFFVSKYIMLFIHSICLCTVFNNNVYLFIYLGVYLPSLFF